MSRKKRIVPFFFILLLLNIALMQPAHAEDIKDSRQKLTIWMPDITQDDYFIQTTINKEDINSINNKLFDLLDLFYLSISLESPGGSEITLEEWDVIKVNLRYFIESISSLDETLTITNIDQLINDVVDAIINPVAGGFLPNPVISIGLGSTWIPFYDYESFLGVMLRPMITRYCIGFSKVGGLTSTNIILGRYFKLVFGFRGLFINLGDIGFNRIIGPTIYIGRAYMVRAWKNIYIIISEVNIKKIYIRKTHYLI